METARFYCVIEDVELVGVRRYVSFMCGKLFSEEFLERIHGMDRMIPLKFSFLITHIQSPREERSNNAASNNTALFAITPFSASRFGDSLISTLCLGNFTKLELHRCFNEA
jgi:hypothetical protein